MEFVSLGSSCSIAYNLNEYKLRKEAYPFDWTRTNNLNNVSIAIDTLFDDFLNLDKFKFKCFSKNFEVNGKLGSYIYYNDCCSFFHDFNGLISEIDTKEFEDKYKRRINRFINLLKSDKEITFIREEFRKLNKNKIVRFIKSIKNLNKNINFSLIIITNDLNYQSMEIDNVTFYYSNIAITNWKRPELKNLYLNLKY